jgi:hypothetical protein
MTAHSGVYTMLRRALIGLSLAAIVTTGCAPDAGAAVAFDDGSSSKPSVPDPVALPDRPRGGSADFVGTTESSAVFRSRSLPSTENSAADRARASLPRAGDALAQEYAS